ncbi:putative AC9 transposase [Bienertia sinuspersici]
MLLTIVVVLDPWYKIVLVRSAFSKLYVPVEVEAHFKEIYDALVEIIYDTFAICLLPFMSRIAKDVLAVPITSVAAESSFSMDGRILTKHRLSLRTDNVEAFVTTPNWLFGYLKDDKVQDCFEVMKDVMPDDVDHDSLPRGLCSGFVYVSRLLVWWLL